MVPWLLVGLAAVVLALTVPLARGAFGEMPEPPVLDDPPVREGPGHPEDDDLSGPGDLPGDTPGPDPDAPVLPDAG
ncbi:hypothetical protein SDC9_66307 [bioreactor metagenome]|uniref:Uncharacterized protein n=2 Tax=root TaxID=1 RepID=A0A644XUJ1_9ZZZZ